MTTSIIHKEEIDKVIKVLNEKILSGQVRAYINRAIFRVSLYGLRREEITLINIGDVNVEGTRPAINLPASAVKGKKVARTAPLWWDNASFMDVKDFHDFRVSQGALASDPFFISEKGNRMTVDLVGKRFKTCIRCLPDHRVKELSIHKARHTFCSNALNSGRSLVAVRDAAGHLSVETTNRYLHLVEDETLPDLYGKKKSNVKWADVTSYQQNSPKIPRTWETRFSGIRLKVHRNIHYDPDVWLATSYPKLLDEEVLDSFEADDAKIEAMNKIREVCENILKSF